MAESTLRCSQCGGPVTSMADPSTALSEEELAALPTHLLARARLLCASCAEPAAPFPATAAPDATQNPTSPTSTRERYYRVILTVQEQNPDSTEWENVGGFTLRGSAGSVAEFVARQSEEFGKRMQVILDFADQ